MGLGWCGGIFPPHQPGVHPIRHPQHRRLELLAALKTTGEIMKWIVRGLAALGLMYLLGRFVNWLNKADLGSADNWPNWD